MEVGWHASHEQFPPDELLMYARLAEQHGFAAVLSSDHFASWSTSHEHTGLSWAWLGAAMAQTAVPYAVVAAPSGRYHPAVVAQAIATLDRMFPGRLACALGSGEALNEHITGEPWPAKGVRADRLDAAAGAIRSLLDGGEVDMATPVAVHRARLRSLATGRPPLFAAALTPSTARRVGHWARGLITVNAPLPKLAAVLEAFRATAGAEAPCHVQIHLAWAVDDATARQVAVDNWRVNALSAEQTQDLVMPEDIEAATSDVTADDLVDSVVMVSGPESLHAYVTELAGLGVQRVYLHHVGRDQREFLQAMGPAIAGW